MRQLIWCRADLNRPQDSARSYTRTPASEQCIQPIASTLCPTTSPYFELVAKQLAAQPFYPTQGPVR